jgi:ferredoxin-type protein NapH
MLRGLNLQVKRLAVPLVMLLAFWTLAVVGWRATGYLGMLLNFGYLGTALGIGLGLYAVLPKKKKPIGRRVSLLLVGIYLLGFVGLAQPENIQIEGVFLSLLSGAAGAALMHYMVAKIVGPLLFGRMWCGWACWSAMVFDLLPYRRSAGRLPGRWGWLRYAHFALSLGLVLVLWYGLMIRPGVHGLDGLLWLAVGNLLYYAVGIGLAVALKDNRAFCKYICPITLPLKIASRFALIKVRGDAVACTGCQACTTMCPMDIRIPDYVAQGTRVLSTECTLCQTCISTCPHDVLKLSFGFDLGGQDLLREREPVAQQLTVPGD